jgi:hypothetical protein
MDQGVEVLLGTYTSHLALCTNLRAVEGQNPWNEREQDALFLGVRD